MKMGLGTYSLTQSLVSDSSGTAYRITPQSPMVGEANTTLTFTLTRSGVLNAETVYVSTLYGARHGYADNSGNSDYMA